MFLPSTAFLYKCQVLVLIIMTVAHFWQLKNKMRVRPIDLSFWHCINDTVALKDFHPPSSFLYTNSESTGNELSLFKYLNYDSGPSVL